MAQSLIQTQEQKLLQQQRLTQQQMLLVRLTEMPVAELEENVNAELDDNPALEAAPADEGHTCDDAPSDAMDDDGDTPSDDDSERADDIDKALESIASDDEMPATYKPGDTDNAEYEEMVYGDQDSFYDKLREQVGELDIDERQRYILEYIIGSLDDDGLLRKDIQAICDELEVYHNIECSPNDVRAMLSQLQTFDPPGIGAQSLQQCLLIQLSRMPESEARDVTQLILNKRFAMFMKKNWEGIKSALHLTDAQMRLFREQLRKLNPKPGAALGEAEGRNMQQITPDFIVDTDDSGAIHMYLNSGDVPELKVSESFANMIAAYRNNRKGLSRQEKEALLYAKEKVEKAQGYITAIKQRRATLTATMRAIIDWQRRFFTDGDETELRPMVLKDIAAKTGLDISTVSRVCNVKYVQTNWGIFPLRFFFNTGYTASNGEELSTHNMKLALSDIIAKEDKTAPLNDTDIAKQMASRGFPVARRTISKYREQLGIPPARQRREMK